MMLFYELSQLNLEAEQLHQEILNEGFPVVLDYLDWTWTNADNHQFACMNEQGQKNRISENGDTSRGVGTGKAALFGEIGLVYIQNDQKISKLNLLFDS